MRLSHVHINVQNFEAVVSWFENTAGLKPSFQNDRMASIPADSISLIVDRSDEDSTATIAFESNNCDLDYKTLLSRGAIAISAPEDQPWGVRAAYIKGPGRLTIEVEQPLTE